MALPSAAINSHTCHKTDKTLQKSSSVRTTKAD